MKFYEGFDRHNMPTVWHDPAGDGYTPVPVLTKLHVPPGYWDEVVHRLTHDPRRDALERLTMDTEYHLISGQLAELTERYNLTLAWERSAHQTINMLNAENRALHAEIRRLRDAGSDVRGACGDCA